MSILIKICGIRDAETLAVALDAGADMVGLVFFPPSPRNVSLALGRDLAAAARGRASCVALTVDADDALLETIVNDVAPDFIQMHGRETPDRVAEVKRRCALPIIKAIGIAAASDLAAIAPFQGVADTILLDAKPPQGADRPGGHGRAFDWSIITALDPALPFMLSGGLRSDNVAAAIAATGAPAIDVSSGVERAPGLKDEAMIGEFIGQARAARKVSEDR